MSTGELTFNSVRSSKFVATFETTGSHAIIVEVGGDYVVVKIINDMFVIRLNINGEFKDVLEYDNVKLLLEQANILMSHPEFTSVKDLWNWYLRSVYERNANAVFS